MAEERKDKNVLFVISNLAIGGGAEKVASTIAGSFLNRGVPTTMLTFYTSPREHVFAGERISMHEATPASVPMKLPRAMKRIWQVKKVCKEKRIDVLVSFLEESNYYSLLSKVLRFNKTPMIVSVRNDPTKYNQIYQFLIRFLYPRAEKVVAVTKGVEELLRKNFGLSNTTTIYNPLDWEQIDQKSDKQVPEEYSWLKEKGPLFLTIGRLAKQKGQWHLIRAFSEVVKREPTATLGIIGEGPYRDILQSYIVDLQLGNNVFLLGRQENVYPFLKIADVFVFSSLWEGMPNVLLEAAASGCRIVAAEASTGVREILAPELEISEDISYPYRAKYGTILAPFDEGSDAQTMFRKSLTKKETAFAEEMLRVVQDSSQGSLLGDKRFDIKEIVDKWHRLATSI